MKVIIDCDVGIDDAYAIMLASLLDNVEILAFTVAHGNSTADNCLANTKLLLDKLYKNRQQPPIYLGCNKPILFNHLYETPYFGCDGFGEFTKTVFSEEIKEIKELYLDKLKNSDHASLKILELVNKYPNEITIICLAPLTNLAVALRLSHNPDRFCKNIKNLIIMGGDEPSDGPVKSIEANFLIDPISAKVVIDEYSCPITICPFQMTIKCFSQSVNMPDLKQLFERSSINSPRCKFMQTIGIVFNKDGKFIDYISCDYIAMLVALKSEECKTIYKQYRSCTIDTTTQGLKGLIKVDVECHKNSSENIKFAFDMDSTKPYEYLLFCIEKMMKMDIDNDDNKNV